MLHSPRGSCLAEPPMLAAAIERGTAFLAARQLPSGEFVCYRSTDATLKTARETDSSPFPTALIAYSLGFVGSSESRAMLARAMTFFVAEMEGPGMWRYWTRAHVNHGMIPVDLDDVACVSYVLRREGVPFPSNARLLAANRDRNGRFHTWIVPRMPLPRNFAWWRVALWQWANPAKAHYFWKLNECEPQDVDGVVNANVLLYLGSCDETRGVVPYLETIMRNGEEARCDKWHLNVFTFHYSIARAFRDGVRSLGAMRNESVRRIVEHARPDGGIGNSELDTALAVCALVAWQSESPALHRAVDSLLARQGVAGEWPATVMYYGGPKRFFGWGSEELTTGFCLEALARFRMHVSSRTPEYAGP
ncbi:MAG: hypothetical protein ABI625_01475 [bacterium]